MEGSEGGFYRVLMVGLKAGEAREGRGEAARPWGSGRPGRREAAGGWGCSRQLGPTCRREGE
jgi:hypothetical protein